ncbi:MAG: AAA family ATPase [Chloroflexota bacterium]|nr:AAA family ATPase [Gammaproteobacteria bacterium]MDE2640188.1 AAA family ATPase [Chloroflexota bacterium]
MNWDFDMATLDAGRVRDAVAAAVAELGLLSISGRRGSGKTLSVWRALERSGATVVEPIRLDRERLTLADVLAAIVRDLSTERPRHSNEARAGQARRLLRGAAGPVALLIDDAHGLHHNTLRGLKRLRELGARGRRRGALAIVLTGQSDATSRVPEVGLRSAHLALAGLTAGEIAGALRGAMGAGIEEAAAARIAQDPRAANWLDMQALARAAAREAELRGGGPVTAADAEKALGERREQTAPERDGADDARRMAAVRAGGRAARSAA